MRLVVGLTLFILRSFTFCLSDTASTEFYTLSLHDALPISPAPPTLFRVAGSNLESRADHPNRDRKSTRLNSSHVAISYAVFCSKKKKVILQKAGVWRYNEQIVLMCRAKMPNTV